MKNTLLIIFIAAGIIVLFYALKKLKLRYLILSALSGVLALIAADFICSFFQFNLPINAFTLTLSAIGGIPGVILLNILSVIFI